MIDWGGALQQLAAFLAAATALATAAARVKKWAEAHLITQVSAVLEALQPNGGSSIGDLPRRLTEVLDGLELLDARLGRVEEQNEIMRHVLNRRNSPQAGA